VPASGALSGTGDSLGLSAATAIAAAASGELSPMVVQRALAALTPLPPRQHHVRLPAAVCGAWKATPGVTLPPHPLPPLLPLRLLPRQAQLAEVSPGFQPGVWDVVALAAPTAIERARVGLRATLRLNPAANPCAYLETRLAHPQSKLPRCMPCLSSGSG
jgi:hypothetical protein